MKGNKKDRSKLILEIGKETKLQLNDSIFSEALE